MKILFVYPNYTKQLTPQVGIASLLSVIRKKHKLEFFDFSIIKPKMEFEAYREVLGAFQPDVIMVSCRTNEWGLVKLILENSFPTPVVVGGIHATIVPEEVMNLAKIIIRGEGEETVEELLDKMEKGKDITKIPNVWVKQRGQIYRNDVRPLIQNLDKLPIPSWDKFHKFHFEGSYIKNLYPDINCVGTFEASRGCIYSCSYCSNEYLQNLYKGKGSYHRKKSPQRVVTEIAIFKRFYPNCNFLYFIDETFMIEKEWLEEYNRLCDKTPYVFMTRPEMVTEEKMRLVAESGGRAVSIGIESGNEKLRKEVLNRKMSQEQIIRAFKIAKDCGLDTYSFNMVGLPYESADDILATIELNKKIKPKIAQFTTFFPLKGTRLFDICKKEGWISFYPELFNYYSNSILKLPNFKEGELHEWVKRAEAETESN